MTHPLAPCPACSRHIRTTETACPFCGAARPQEGPSSVRTGTRALGLAGALLAASLSAGGGADAQPMSPRLTMDHAPAQGYGAPPGPSHDLGGFYRRPPAPPVSPPVAPPVAPSTVSVDVSPRGLRAVQLERALRLRSTLWARCRDAAPTRVPEAFVGQLRVDLGPDGRVVGLALRDAPAAVGPILRCVATRMRSVRLARGPAAQIEVTLRYGASPAGSPEPGVVRGVGDASPGACGASPAGCRRTGCGAGLVCDTRVRCVPSSCGCDPGTGRWTCTSDCGGGVCVPDR